jgi:capsule polysaccharide export protein KpsE/RkpR
LISRDEQHGAVTADTQVSMQVSFPDMVKYVWQYRRLPVILGAAGFVVALGISLLLPNEYESTAALMPPEQQSLSNMSLLTSLTGISGSSASPVANLLNTRSPGATFIGILDSVTAQDDLIKRYNLMKAYHCKYYIQCRNKLSAQTSVHESETDGIIKITVMDTDRNRARDLVQGYLDELDKLVNDLSTSSARREREFLEQRLKSIKADLDSTSLALSQFSSRNATINPQNQGQELLQSVAKLQDELISDRAQLSALKAQYSDDNVRVREMRAQVMELQAQIRGMGNPAVDSSGNSLNNGELYPSIRELPVLGVTYANLTRQLALQEGIYEALAKQYEFASVEESKEIPAIKVLDTPQPAEIKSRPHRAVMVIMTTILSAAVGIFWLAFRKLLSSKGQLPIEGLG